MKCLIIDERGSIRYPIDLKKEFPYTSFPDVIKLHNLPAGVHAVQGTEPPAVPDEKHHVVESTPEHKNGVWCQVWKVVPFSDEEINHKIKEMKSLRNKLLSHTDWTQLNDVPYETSNKYKKYRQELRDITKHPEFPFVDLPEISNATT